MGRLPRPFQAIILVCMGALCFTLNDTLTKFMIDRYPVTVIIFVRSLIAIPLLFLLARSIGRQWVGWSSNMLLHATRGTMNLVAAYLYIRGLEYLSVAEAVVIAFASPFLITASSALIFKEHVSWQTWAAVIVSFLGVMVAMRPGSSAFQPASLFILAASALYAANSLSARWIPPADSLWAVSLYGAGFAALLISPVAVSNWVDLHLEDGFFFVGAALCSSLGIGLSAIAYRLAAPADLAPFGYSGLIWSLGVTWLVWGTIPDVWTFAGAALIAASSVFHLVSPRKVRSRKDTKAQV